MNTHHGHFRRWTAAWILAILLHTGIIATIAFQLIPDENVQISGMIPPPDETVELMPAQAIEPAVFFAAQPESISAGAALLYKIEDDGSRKLLSEAHLHPRRNFALQFDAVRDPGTYEIVIHDGQEGAIPPPRALDGEFAGKFPTGDGTPGGAFKARFKLAQKQSEVMTASLYDPQKPLANEEPAARSIQQKQQEPQPQPQQQKPQKPQKKSQPKQPKPSQAPKSTAVAQNVGPVESQPEPSDEPSPVALTPADLRLNPFNIAPALATESAEIAQKSFAERDTNKFVTAAATAKKRFESAYAEGPVIGRGQQGNSLSHQKDVAEYLALMHKEIHPLWAHGYLLRLDTIYRQPGSRLDDPNLEAVLEITLDSLGSVIDVRMVRSSGITDYDSEAIHVAWNCSPKLPPPAEMRSTNGRSYIHWTFWRDGRQCGVFGVKVFKWNASKKDALDFSLKAVQIHEKRLGLTPSSLPPRLAPKQNTKPQPTQPTIPPSERINPLED